MINLPALAYADGMSETPPAPRVRIRWGWFIACVVLGLAAILTGGVVATGSGTSDYVAGVLGNVGTTLLLVGVVVLLERRIIDSAVRVVRRAGEKANEELRAQIRDLEARIAAEWDSATADNIDEKTAETARLTDEFTKRVVAEAESRD